MGSNLPDRYGTYAPPLNYAPAFTFSTIQTGNDVLDTIITSILVTLILSNLNSVVSKVISRTHSDVFNFDAYLRLFIYNASDDLTRIFSWLRGKNTYLADKYNYKGAKKKIYIKRLGWPIFARVIVFTAAILSIALAVPAEREFTNCAAGDYDPVFIPNLTNVRDDFVRNSLCVEIELKLHRGNTATTLNFCAEEIESLTTERSELSDNWVMMEYDADRAELSTLFHSGDVSKGVRFYVEWGSERSRFRSLFKVPSGQGFADFTKDTHKDFAKQVIEKSGVSNCQWGDSNSPESSGISYKSQEPLDCSFNAADAARIAELGAYESIRWRFLRELQLRVLIPLLSNTQPSKVYKCPLIVKVSRPIVNIVPLCVTCLLSFMINMAVGFTVQEHGNVDDLLYHVMREALGLDVTCNPLQEPVGKGTPALQLIPYKTYQCADHLHTHGGFLKAPQDKEGPVTDDTYFGSCAHQYRGVADSTIP